MQADILPFNEAYDSYYREIDGHIFTGCTILEVGGGQHPSLMKRANVDYTIIDPDEKELTKSPDDIYKVYGLLEDMDEQIKYDLVLSKMVLEHIEYPDHFHQKIHNLLKPGGKAIHFFACRHSIPAFVNRFLPEFLGDKILQLIGNRDLENSPKYPAFYRRVKGNLRSQNDYFTSMDYKINTYHSFVGHKYFARFWGMSFLEKLYTQLLYKLSIKQLSTVALVVLQKEK